MANLRMTVLPAFVLLLGVSIGPLARANHPVVAQVGSHSIERETLLAAVRQQTALKGEDFDQLSPERQFNYAMTVLQRMVDDLICEQLATDEMRARARARATQEAAKLPAHTPAAIREGLYHYHLYCELAGRAPGDAAEREIRSRWRRQVPVEWRLTYSDVVRAKGRAPRAADWVVAVMMAGGLAAVGGWWLQREGAGRVALAALAAGTLARVAAWAVIPHDYMAYDVEGHLEYVRYVREHRAIPPRDAGFQFYQPPFYYVLGAALTGGEPRGLQTLGLGFSLATFVVGLWAVPGGIGAWLLALHPAGVVTAARINNDAAVTLWVVLAWAAAWRGWGKPDQRLTIVALTATALAVWTKATGLIAVPVVAAMCVRHRQWIGLVALAVMVVARPGGTVAGNVAWLTPGIRLETDWSNWVTFNPWRVVRDPFVNPLLPCPARDNLWEYWVRSALFGEFGFSWLQGWASVAMGLWLAVLALAIWGGVPRGRRNHRELWPILLPVLVVIGAQVVYVWRAPFATSQDFRYLAAVLLPLARLVNEGWNALPRPRGATGRRNQSAHPAPRRTTPRTKAG